MEQLRCQTPKMAEKELLAFLLAHSLVRCVIAEAAATYHVNLERVSFKGSVDALRQYSNAMSQARHRKMRDQLWEDLLNLARYLVPYRPGREEPRAIKRRPKPYQLLNRPRRRFRDIPIATALGKTNPAITEALIKGHSALTLRRVFVGKMRLEGIRVRP